MENSSRILMGRTNDQKPFAIDLHEDYHLLVGGSSGSGKSNLLHLIIRHLIRNRTPYELKLVLIDPKCVEFFVYKDLPHLLTPLIQHEMNEALSVLTNIGNEIERRKSKTFSDAIIRDPDIVVIIDEFTDVMRRLPSKTVEDAVLKIIQKGIRVGVHLIISTSCPANDVFTQRIRDAIPARIAGQLSSKEDSITVLGHSGAEKLNSEGDMLFSSQQVKKPVRFQTDLLPYDEIVKTVANLPIYKEPSPRDNKLKWHEYLLLGLYTVFITAPAFLLILFFRLPIFSKSKREPLKPGVICALYSYDSMTFSEKMIENLKRLLP